MTRPIPLPIRVEGIPDALRVERRWVVWRYEQRNNRWAKILCTTSGYHAKSNDSATWTTFDLALASYHAGGFDGIGFCLGDGWCGIDLDHCRAMAFPLHNRLPDCYLEVSPSGNGFKAIGRAARIGGEINFAVTPPAHTAWHGARFFTITGHEAKGDPTLDLTTLLEDLFPAQRASIVPSPSAVPDYITVGDTRGTENIELRSDDEVLTLAATAINRDKFLKLFRGDLADYGDDRSRADQALVNILVYWCSGDLDQADRLFRQSALMRDKWETRSYRLATLQKAALQEGLR